jgi:hypothetical protein
MRYSHMLRAGLQHRSMHAVSAQSMSAEKVRMMGMRDGQGIVCFWSDTTKRWYRYPEPAIISEQFSAAIPHHFVSHAEIIHCTTPGQGMSRFMLAPTNAHLT